MIKTFKLFEQLEEEESWWEEESPFDEIDSRIIIKMHLIQNPSVNYVDNNLVATLLNLDNRVEVQKIVESINKEGLNKYNMLYDEIDYEKLGVGSVVMSNIPNVDSVVKQYTINKINKNYWNAYINHKEETYSILTYNIKSVIKY